MGHWLFRSLAPRAVAALACVVVIAGADAIPAALAAMADTERAFARLGHDTNWRDAFLVYFAEDAVTFNPEPGLALPRLRALSPPPAGMKLKWEPRVGDVAASGDLGYLTGPSQRSVPGQPVRHGTYFSVWKRQAGGVYRVILDVGVGLPSQAEFAEGFVRSRAVASSTGADTRAAADESLLAADRELGSALAARGAAAAYRAALHPEARVHRPDHMPMTTRESATAWMRANITAMTSEPAKGEAAASRDLGYTWGSWTATDAGGKSTRG